MDLQELVTDTLVEEEAELSPLEILDWRNDKYCPPPLELAEMADQIASGRFDLVPVFAAWASRSSVSNSPRTWPRHNRGLLEILFLAQEAEGGNEKASRQIEESFSSYAEEMRLLYKTARRRETIGNWQKSMDYLRECFGEKTSELLCKLCRVRLQSVRSWENGKARPRNVSSVRITTLASLVYDLREEGVSETAILAWAETPLSTGSTPLESWRAGRLSDEIRESVEKMR